MDAIHVKSPALTANKSNMSRVLTWASTQILTLRQEYMNPVCTGAKTDVAHVKNVPHVKNFHVVSDESLAVWYTRASVPAQEMSQHPVVFIRTPSCPELCHDVQKNKSTSASHNDAKIPRSSVSRLPRSKLIFSSATQLLQNSMSDRSRPAQYEID